ncbi:terpenoid synthase [Marasmius fiardii PR-910]|nr:terpenoid synthase [Marasmius fiardii PR-910]
MNTQGDNNTTSLSCSTKSFIKRMVYELFEKCQITLDKLPFDQDLYDECKEYMASRLHFPSSLYPWFGKYLNVGVVIAFTSYSHLPKCNRMHIAIYTAFATALDDIFVENYEHMEGFNERFVKGISQDDPILDGLAQTLFDTSGYHDRVQSNLIVSSTLDFVTSLRIDMDIPEMTSLSSSSFADFCRKMSGISTAYGMFIYPREIKLKVYVQCLPHMATYINCMNDVLSFYKEEVAGEEENFASMLAKESSISKYEAIQRIADDVAEADKNILRGLADNQLALDSWQSFKRGYVRFHTSCPRYKLDELFDIPSVTSRETR